MKATPPRQLLEAHRDSRSPPTRRGVAGAVGPRFDDHAGGSTVRRKSSAAGLCATANSWSSGWPRTIHLAVANTADQPRDVGIAATVLALDLVTLYHDAPNDNRRRHRPGAKPGGTWRRCWPRYAVPHCRRRRSWLRMRRRRPCPPYWPYAVRRARHRATSSAPRRPSDPGVG